MDRKIIMGVAAVAGIGLLLYLRKSGDSSAIGASGSMLGAAAAANNWASQPYVITTNTKAPAVVDNSAKSPVTKPASTSTVPSFWDGGTAAAPTPTWNPTQNEWETKPGVAVDDNYTYGHLTPAQRGNKTDGQLTLSILGY